MVVNQKTGTMRCEHADSCSVLWCFDDFWTAAHFFFRGTPECCVRHRFAMISMKMDDTHVIHTDATVCESGHETNAQLLQLFHTQTTLSKLSTCDSDPIKLDCGQG